MSRKRSRHQPHYCHAPGCRNEVPRRLLMCRPHWYRLPKPMRDAIWATYRPGQERTGNPSPEYIKNVRAAQQYIAQIESAQAKE